MYLPEIERLKAFYAAYLKADLNQLSSIYADDVEFADPLHEVTGLTHLQRYFAHGRKGLLSCHFEFHSQILMEHKLALEWQMVFAHARLGKAQRRVNGCSVITFCPDSKLVFRHVDYFDLGAMLYENIPVLGSVTKWVKHHAAEVDKNE